MTLQELADTINALPAEDRQKPALVWPPNSCPATARVSVHGIVRGGDGSPMISTGKQVDTPTASAVGS
jgi:hypothetical protein